MSESNIVRARRLSDGTVVEELPDGSTRPLPTALIGRGWRR